MKIISKWDLFLYSSRLEYILHQLSLCLSFLRSVTHVNTACPCVFFLTLLSKVVKNTQYEAGLLLLLLLFLMVPGGLIGLISSWARCHTRGFILNKNTCESWFFKMHIISISHPFSSLTHWNNCWLTLPTGWLSENTYHSPHLCTYRSDRNSDPSDFCR